MKLMIGAIVALQNVFYEYTLADRCDSNSPFGVHF